MEHREEHTGLTPEEVEALIKARRARIGLAAGVITTWTVTMAVLAYLAWRVQDSADAS